jgi:hypothetical protein
VILITQEYGSVSGTDVYMYICVEGRLTETRNVIPPLVRLLEAPCLDNLRYSIDPSLLFLLIIQNIITELLNQGSMSAL